MMRSSPDTAHCGRLRPAAPIPATNRWAMTCTIASIWAVPAIPRSMAPKPASALLPARPTAPAWTSTSITSSTTAAFPTSVRWVLQPPAAIRACVITHPTAIDGDYHGPFPVQGPDYEFQFRLSGLVDIDQRTNLQYIRSPVPGFANNIPPGTVPFFGRLANVPDENNRRFYPDRSLQPILVLDPQTGEQNIAIYPFNRNNPMAGDPVAENATGYLMRICAVDGARHRCGWVPCGCGETRLPLHVQLFRSGRVPGIQPPINLDGSRRDVFSFLEAYTGDKEQLQSLTRKNINPGDPGRVGGNRDVLDFPLFFALRDNLTGNGAVNNWHKIRSASQDSRDDGDANNGSQAVAFAASHDDSSAYLSNVAHAFVLMRPGNAIVYHNAQEFGTGRDFPKDGRGDALGGMFGNTISTLVNLRNTHGRGDFHERWVDDAFNPNGFSNIYAFERENSALVGLNSRLDGGYDERNGVQTAFAPGTRLIELTGNAASALVDPFDEIPGVITVGTDRKVTLRIPRNRNASGQEHGRGFVVYGVAGPQGTLSLSNVAKTIAPETPTSSTNGVSRLSPIDVITANAFDVELRTTAVNLLGNPAFRDRDADGDNAMVRIDEGLDLNGNGQVDYRTPGPTSYGFDEFVTFRQPGYTQPSGNGIYRQSIGATQLAEGYHYLTARAFRHRNAGEPAVFSDFKKVLYVDRQKPLSGIESFAPSRAGVLADRDLVVRSLDGTAYRLTAQELANANGQQQHSGVHVFLDLPAALTETQVLAMVGPNSQAGQYDRDLWRYGFFGLKHGNHVATVVTYEITGNVNVQRLAGLFTQTPNGRGLGDINFDGQFTPSDIANFTGAFEVILYNQNGIFNPAADLDGNGRINTIDLVKLGPTIAAAGASQATIDEWQGVRFRRVNFSGDQALTDVDRNLLRANFGLSSGSNLWRYDLDDNGIVNAADETLLLSKFNPAGAITVQPGADYHISSPITATSLVLPTDSTRVTIDPGVGSILLNDLRFDWPFYEPPQSAAAAVPEPSSVLLAIGAAVLLAFVAAARVS